MEDDMNDLKELIDSLASADKKGQQVILRGGLNNTPQGIIPSFKLDRISDTVKDHASRQMHSNEGSDLKPRALESRGSNVSSEGAGKKRPKSVRFKGGQVKRKLAPGRTGTGSEASSLDRLRASKGEPYRPQLPAEEEVKIAKMVSDSGAGNIFSLDFTSKCFTHIKRNQVNTIAEETAWSCGRMVSGPLLELIDGKSKLGDTGAQSIARLLAVYGTVTRLNLSDNSIGDDGMAHLAGILKDGTTIVAVNLALNLIGSSGAWEITKALKSNTTLRTLNLSGNPIGAEGAKLLAGAIRVNTGLEKLSLRSCGVRDDGCATIAKAMRRNYAIHTLDLTHNSITSEGASALTEMLGTNTSLTAFSVCDNPIDGAEPAALARAVEAHPKLSLFNLLNLDEMKMDLIDHLDLSFRRCGNVGAHLVAAHVSKAIRLRSLDLRNNNLDDTAVRVLMEVVARAEDIAAVDLRGNDTQTVIPAAIAEKGGEAVVEQMRATVKKGHGTLPRMKWMLLGRSETGKSSLFRALREAAEGTTLDEPDGPTVGVEIFNEFRPFEGHPLRVAVYDTSGHSTYWRAGNTMHLTESRTLNLLTFDLSCGQPAFLGSGVRAVWDEEDEMIWVQYWTRMLLVHAPRAVVVMVGTKSDLVDDETRDRRMEAAKEVFHATVKAHRREMEERLAGIAEEDKALVKQETAVKADAAAREARNRARPPWEEPDPRGPTDTAGESLAGRLGAQRRAALAKEAAHLESLLAARLSVVGECSVSSQDVDSVDALRKVIKRAQNNPLNFPDVSRVVPAPWMALLEAVTEHQGSPATPLVMRWDDFAAGFQDKCGFAGAEALEDGVAFLRSLGAVLHHRGVVESVVLKPQEVAEKFRQLIRLDMDLIASKLNFPWKRMCRSLASRGVLETSLVPQLLHGSDRQSDEAGARLVELMVDLEIALPYGPGRCLMPAYFPDHPGAEVARLWEPTASPEETVVGLRMLFRPLPSAFYERALARTRELFQLQPGSWKADRGRNKAQGVNAGALLTSRRDDTRVLLRVDGDSVWVIARAPKPEGVGRATRDPVEQEDSLWPAVELRWILDEIQSFMRESCPGTAWSTYYFCPTCLRQPNRLKADMGATWMDDRQGQWDAASLHKEHGDVLRERLLTPSVLHRPGTSDSLHNELRRGSGVELSPTPGHSRAGTPGAVGGFSPGGGGGSLPHTPLPAVNSEPNFPPPPLAPQSSTPGMRSVSLSPDLFTPNPAGWKSPSPTSFRVPKKGGRLSRASTGSQSLGGGGGGGGAGGKKPGAAGARQPGKAQNPMLRLESIRPGRESPSHMAVAGRRGRGTVDCGDCATPIGQWERRAFDVLSGRVRSRSGFATFISTREAVPRDHEAAKALHAGLVLKLGRPYWPHLPGLPVEDPEQMAAQAMVESTAFVPIVSDPAVAAMRYLQTGPRSRGEVDPLLVEWTMALALRREGLLDAITPIATGGVVPAVAHLPVGVGMGSLTRARELLLEEGLHLRIPELGVRAVVEGILAAGGLEPPPPPPEPVAGATPTPAAAPGTPGRVPVGLGESEPPTPTPAPEGGAAAAEGEAAPPTPMAEPPPQLDPAPVPTPSPAPAPSPSPAHAPSASRPPRSSSAAGEAAAAAEAEAEAAGPGGAVGFVLPDPSTSTERRMKARVRAILQHVGRVLRYSEVLGAKQGGRTGSRGAGGGGAGGAAAGGRVAHRKMRRQATVRKQHDRLSQHIEGVNSRFSRRGDGAESGLDPLQEQRLESAWPAALAPGEIALGMWLEFAERELDITIPGAERMEAGAVLTRIQEALKRQRTSWVLDGELDNPASGSRGVVMRDRREKTRLLVRFDHAGVMLVARMPDKGEADADPGYLNVAHAIRLAHHEVVRSGRGGGGGTLPHDPPTATVYCPCCIRAAGEVAHTWSPAAAERAGVHGRRLAEVSHEVAAGRDPEFDCEHTDMGPDRAWEVLNPLAAVPTGGESGVYLSFKVLDSEVERQVLDVVYNRLDKYLLAPFWDPVPDHKNDNMPPRCRDVLVSAPVFMPMLSPMYLRDLLARCRRNVVDQGLLEVVVALAMDREGLGGLKAVVPLLMSTGDDRATQSPYGLIESLEDDLMVPERVLRAATKVLGFLGSEPARPQPLKKVLQELVRRRCVPLQLPAGEVGSPGMVEAMASLAHTVAECVREGRRHRARTPDQDSRASLARMRSSARGRGPPGTSIGRSSPGKLLSMKGAGSPGGSRAGSPMHRNSGSGETTLPPLGGGAAKGVMSKGAKADIA